MLPNERTTRSEVVPLPGEVEALVAAPSRTAARPLVAFLKAEKINVQLVVESDSAYEEALLHHPHVVLIDDRVPPSGGIELCQRLKSNGRTHFTPAILFAQSDAQKLKVRALAAGADAVFGPGSDEEERRTRLWALLRTQALYRRQEKLQRDQGSDLHDRRRWVGAFIHDLQSSIGALQGNFEYLSQALQGKTRPGSGELDECQTDTAIIFRQVARGLRNVLDYERCESGRMTLKQAAVSLADVAAQVQAELSWYARTAGKSLEVEETTAEALVSGDGEYLKEALISLASFLLRQPGNRRVAIKVEASAGAARVSLVGDGERVASEQREHMFEPYASLGRRGAGEGLGLALARVVIGMHGGIVRVADGPQAGTALVVELTRDGSAPNLRTVE
jgi:K+-sensing histidine kinase KdpD